MRGIFVPLAAIMLLSLGSLAQADVFNLGQGLTNLETVTVGDAGNAADMRVQSDGTSGYGSVAYNYNIGKYEVTTAQYCDFLNNKAKSDPYGLWNSYMADTVNNWGCNIQRSGSTGDYTYTLGSGSQTDITNWGNRPMNSVNFWDACRFANWLGNGQGDGDTETGAYTLTPDGIANNTITRNANWTWAVTSEDEWYKAAYYKGNGLDAGYWSYPTQSNNAPSTIGSDGYIDPGNHANSYNKGFTIGSPYYRTNVGEFENSASAYGTFDQAGNVFEWNEAVLDGTDRCLRGGSFGWTDAIQASVRSHMEPWSGDFDFGFRLVAVPEPSSIIALLSGVIPLIRLTRRKA